MAMTETIGRVLAGEMRLMRGRILRLEQDGTVRVRLDGESGPEVLCEVLRAAGAGAALRPDESVLVAVPAGNGLAVVLGGIGGRVVTPESEPAVERGGEQPALERQVVIEAGEELTLRCGEASIRITQDGRVVIRGEHILSRARGTQRIRGGSVAIN